jgi:hypothetical protein
MEKSPELYERRRLGADQQPPKSKETPAVPITLRRSPHSSPLTPYSRCDGTAQQHTTLVLFRGPLDSLRSLEVTCLGRALSAGDMRGVALARGVPQSEIRNPQSAHFALRTPHSS